jgi:hypothetical protein
MNYTATWKMAGVSGGTWAAVPYQTPGDFDVDANTIEVLQAFIRRDFIDTWLSIQSKKDYMDLMNKTITGFPQALYYDKQRIGHIYLNPQPDYTYYSEYVLHYLRESYLEDFGTVNDDPDFQSMYIDFLVKQLRSTLAPKYKKDIQMIGLYRAEADEAFKYLRKKETVEPNMGESVSPAWTVGRRGGGYGSSGSSNNGNSGISIDSP